MQHLDSPHGGTWLASFLSKLTLVGSLTHDIGKLSNAFQTKLLDGLGRLPRPGTNSAEYIRHEAVSYFLLRRLGSLSAYASLVTLDSDGLQALVAVEDAVTLRQLFEKQLKADTDLLDALLHGRGPTPRLDELGALLVAYLSLTHHRLPGVRSPEATYYYEMSKVADAHFNLGLAARYRECLTFSRGNPYSASYPDSLAADYLAAVTDLTNHISQAPADLNLAALVRLALNFARPTMILGDHLGSALKQPATKGPVSPATLLANTRESADGLEIIAGDTYSAHIRSVTRHTRVQTQLALSLIAREASELPTLSLAAQTSIAAKRGTHEKFKWQAEAFSYLKQNLVGLPTFCLVTAETGSGKTIASAQIAQALGSTRFTYLLGMRSLTLQTGESYRKDLGLTAADLAVVVGDRISKKSFDAFGSESLVHDDLLTQGGQACAQWLDALQIEGGPHPKFAFGDKVLNFISTPVAVSTIDQLISLTRLHKVPKSKEFLRVYSSDFILDEVDNYSPSELKHVQRLCYLAGLAGKHVICLSATLGPLHAHGLLHAYRRGLADCRQLVPGPQGFQLACLSNLTPPESVAVPLADTSLAACDAFVRAFNLKTIQAQQGHRLKTTLGVLDTHALDFPAITAEVAQLHAYNGFAVADRNVSVGFVRFNQVKTARAYASYLLESAELGRDTEVCVLCYHARNSALALWVSDNILATLTNRKGLPAGTDLSPQAIQQYVEPLAAATPAKNLIFVVATTSLLETGRDHDYDWAILEPNSHRSLIQSAGRVRRHREWLDTLRNVSVIQLPVRVLTANKQAHSKNPLNVWVYPGILTSLHTTDSPAYRSDCPEAYRALVRAAKLALKNPLALANYAVDCTATGLLGTAYARGISSSVALTPPELLNNAIALLEQYALYRTLLDPSATLRAPFNKSSGVRAEQALLSDWAYRESFRNADDDAAVTYYFAPPPARDTVDTNFRVAATPVSELGDLADCRHEQLTPAQPHRDMLTLGVPGGGQARLQLAAEAHALRGFTPAELWHLTRYSPRKSEHTYWCAQLGYCDQSSKNL